MITGYHVQQSAQKDREPQFKNKEEAHQPDVLEAIAEAINESHVAYPCSL